ncbi:MAG: radical SAM protein, partial [Sphingopyxis sp.]|nr:radical SAM protein [Sphingopyxis sp.]
MEPAKPLPPISGRGAPTNLRPTRTGSLAREADGDWLDAAEDVDGV